MPRFMANEADNYGSSGRSSFFSLKNDGDVARVRYMYNGSDDVCGYAVHQVDIGDSKRYVNCIRSYDEPKSKCPFCSAGNFVKAKIYVPLYDVDEQEVKMWERGKNYFATLSGLCSRYSSADVPLVSHVFEIERHGKKGDTSTTYASFEVSKDDTTLEDLPEVPDVIGTIILDKSADEMKYYLDNGEFPNGNETAARRPRQSDGDAYVSRRTPSRHRDETEEF